MLLNINVIRELFYAFFVNSNAISHNYCDTSISKGLSSEIWINTQTVAWLTMWILCAFFVVVFIRSSFFPATKPQKPFNWCINIILHNTNDSMRHEFQAKLLKIFLFLCRAINRSNHTVQICSHISAYRRNHF